MTPNLTRALLVAAVLGPAAVAGCASTACQQSPEVDRQSSAAGQQTAGEVVDDGVVTGTYLRAAKAGFAPQTLEQLVVRLGTQVEVELVLAIANLVESVVVSASPRLVDPQKTAAASVIAQDQIENLPINRRNFIAFSLLTPGVVADLQ